MKTIACILCLVLLSGCTSVPTDPTPRQQVVANAVEDALSIGLVPVLAKNRGYIPVALSSAAALATFSGDALTGDQIAVFVNKTGLSADDAATIQALVTAAWDTYSRRYAQQVNSSVRPDVRLFLSAVANGINRAVAALPK